MDLHMEDHDYHILHLFHAMAASGLQIQSLNIFTCPGQPGYGLPCDAFGNIDWDNRGLAESLSSVQLVSISTMNRVLVKHDLDEDEDKSTKPRKRRQNKDLALAQDGKIFTGLTSLLRLMYKLEILEIHYFRAPGNLVVHSPADFPHEKLL